MMMWNENATNAWNHVNNATRRRRNLPTNEQ